MKDEANLQGKRCDGDVARGVLPIIQKIVEKKGEKGKGGGVGWEGGDDIGVDGIGALRGYYILLFKGEARREEKKGLPA